MCVHITVYNCRTQ